MKRKELYKKAIQFRGVQFEINMLFEELAELQKVVCECFNRGKMNKNEVSEEIADVEIMLEQLKFILDIGEQVNTEKIRKLHKLQGKFERC